MSLLIFKGAGTAGNGLFPGEMDVTITNRSAGTFALGDLVMFDLTASAAASTSVDPGGAGTSIYNNCVAPSNAAGGGGQFIRGYFAVVVGGSAVVGAETLVRVFGTVDQAFCIDADASIAIGDGLQPAAAKNLDGGTTSLVAGAKQVGRARQVFTTPTSRTLGKVDFNGVTGFGYNAG